MTKTVSKIFTELIKLADESDDKYLEMHSEEQVMMHCAEEMSECSAALLKLLRVRAGKPISSMTEEHALEHGIEELADALSTGFLLMKKMGCEIDIAETHLRKSSEFALLIDGEV